MTSQDAQARSGVPALAVLAALVIGGVGVGAGYYRWAQPRAARETAAVLAQYPENIEGRVQLWVEHAMPILHERLSSARISAQQPWIVTHQVRDPDGGPPAVYGIATAAIEHQLARAEGTAVHVTLPAPRLLAETRLVGDHARSVRTVDAGEEIDPAAVLKHIAEYALRFQIEKLEKDLPGATLVVEVAEPGS